MIPRVLDMAGNALHDTLDTEYKIPTTRNNYKGEEVLAFVLPAEAFAASLVPPLAFHSSEPVAVPATTAVVQAPTTVAAIPAPKGLPKHKDHDKWSSALNARESLLYTALLTKPNPIGMGHKRQLLLTDAPRFLYLDPKNKKVMGTIEWQRGNPPVTYAV